MALKAGRYGVTKEQLRKIDSGGGGGTTVVANPEGAATADLTKLKVGDTIYGVEGDTSACYQTTDDTESAIVDADYIPFLDSSAASGAGAPKKSTWSNFCSKIAAKFENVFNAYLGVTSIGSGLTVDVNGVLVATGSGSGGWPAISEMTAPTIVESRVASVSGGYKQVGKTVYVDVSGVINASLSNNRTFPEFNYWTIFDSLPRPMQSESLNIELIRNTDDRPIFLMAILYEWDYQGSERGAIEITGCNNVNYSVGDTFSIRGTYEAYSAI